MKCEIDARGLACPQPVVLTKNKMKQCSLIEIIVDNETAVENIKRLASSSGWSYENILSGENYKIILKQTGSQILNAQREISSSCSCENSTIVFSSDKMGKGDDDLGTIIMKAFIHTLASLEPAPAELIFYNSGVILTAEGSGVVDDLEVLQNKGVRILICGTCVNYYNLQDKIKTGLISNMSDILDTMNKANRIINP